MATLLHATTLPNGWTVEEWDSSSRVYVRPADAPDGVLGRFTAMLHRVPSRRIVRVHYFQGASLEDRVRNLTLAKNATTTNWRHSSAKWWKKRAKNGKYRFYASIGRRIEVDETFAELIAQLDTSTEHQITTDSEAAA